jgi:uncharacterized protein YjbI with pentapeptide repeats
MSAKLENTNHHPIFGVCKVGKYKSPPNIWCLQSWKIQIITQYFVSAKLQNTYHSLLFTFAKLQGANFRLLFTSTSLQGANFRLLFTFTELQGANHRL